MKKLLKPLILPLFFLCFMAFSQVSPAQAPPPPPTSGAKGDATNKGPGGGGAPIDGGVAICLAMIAGFGGWKVYRSVYKKREAVDN